MLNNVDCLVTYSEINATPYEIPFMFWVDDEIAVYVASENRERVKLEHGSANGYRIVKYSTLKYVQLKNPGYWGQYNRLIIERNVRAVQQSKYQNGAPINGPVIEYSFDRLTAMIQELQEKTSRQISLPVLENAEGVNLEIPSKDARGDSILCFSQDGTKMFSYSLEEFRAVKRSYDNLEQEIIQIMGRMHNAIETVEDLTAKVDVVRVDIKDSNGNVFRKGMVNNTLTAIVIKNKIDITDELDESAFCWKRNSGNEYADNIWALQPKANGHKTIHLNNADCDGRTVFTCEVEI